MLGLRLINLCCLFGFVVTFANETSDQSLRLLITIFRHGARNPTTTYNSDPYKNYKWPDGLGALTNKGKQQIYNFGKKYREHYSNFIPNEYHEKDVYVRSSDISRCLMSAYIFLAGLYPPSERQTWNQYLHWQPIPVHSLPVELDNIVTGTKHCNLYNRKYMEVYNEKNSDIELKDLFTHLSKETRQDLRNITIASKLYSSLLAIQTEGLKLPEWTSSFYPDKLHITHKLSLALLSYNEKLLRLRVGPLLSKFKNHMEHNVNNKNSRKLYIYSAHDVNVVSLWRALGFRELLDPEYGASLTLELHQVDKNNDYVIKVFYRNNTDTEVPMELKLSFCDSPCPYNRFITYINRLVPEDWTSECEN